MTVPSSEPGSGAPSPPPPAEPLAAGGLAWLGAGVLGLLGLVWPALVGWQQALLAAWLLGLPALALRASGAAARGVTVDDLGVRMGPWRRTLGLALLACLVVFPPYVAGYHGFRTLVRGDEPAWSAQALARWSVRWDAPVDEPPDAPCRAARRGVRGWMGRHGLWLVAPPDGRPLSVRLSSPAVETARAVRCPDDGPPRLAERRPVPADGTVTSGERRGLWVPVGDRDRLEATVTRGGAPVEAGRLRLGASGWAAAEPGRLELTKTPWWLVAYLIVHLGLVALPEEWFFRGYLQARLDQLLGTPRRLGGAPVGWGLPLAAAAFALLHPILLPGFHRLLVFFPALLFGWLRARGGTIGPAVVVHALSNLLLAVVSRMYVPS